MSEASKYELKVTGEQKLIFLNFMDEHPDFAKGKLLGVAGRKIWQGLWDTLAANLNNCDGPNKTIAKWQRVWTDLKNKTKTKASKINNHRGGTGGGPALTLILSDFENRIVDLLSEDAVYGLEGPDGVPLDSEPDNNMEQPEEGLDDDVALPQYFVNVAEIDLESTTSPAILSDTSEDTIPGTGMPRHNKSKAGQTAAVFEEQGNTFNTIMQTLNNKIDQLIEEERVANDNRKMTNEILYEMLQLMKSKSE